MRTIVVLVFVLLAAAPSAFAKGPVAARVCGVSECVRLTDRQVLAAVSYWTAETTSPSVAAPYYTVAVEWGHERSSRLYWVPSGRALAYFYAAPAVVWIGLGEAGGRALAKATEGIEPLPTPKLTQVFVGGRRVHGDLDSYLTLFDGRAPAAVESAETIRIALRSARRSPWTHGIHFYYPGSNVFETGLAPVRLPDDLAARIESAAPLGGDESIPWRLLSASMVGVVLLAAAVLVLHARFPRPSGRRLR